MSSFDDVERLRLQQAASALTESSDRGTRYPARSLVARTKTVTTYPTVAARYYAMERIFVSGSEVELDPGVFIPKGGTFYALNLGTRVPPSGTTLVVNFTNNRWTFIY